LPTLRYDGIVIPGLAGDLERVEIANRLGLLQRTHPLLTLLTGAVLILLLLSALAIATWWLLRRRQKATPAT
jgi:hypothetical protein